jgi:hypothetical protein
MPDIPQSMIEAAAWAFAALQPFTTTPPNEALLEDARLALAAALSTCTVREEWRAQITYPAGDEGHTQWWPVRRDAEIYIGALRGSSHTYTLQRRLVIETPGEDVP